MGSKRFVLIDATTLVASIQRLQRAFLIKSIDIWHTRATS